MITINYNWVSVLFLAWFFWVVFFLTDKQTTLYVSKVNPFAQPLSLGVNSHFSTLLNPVPVGMHKALFL